MVHTCCTTEADKAALIAAAKASGAGIVRLDVEVHGIVRPASDGYRYDFSSLDQVIALGRRHGIDILAVLSGTPAGMTDCLPAPRSRRAGSAPPPTRTSTPATSWRSWSTRARACSRGSSGTSPT
jgi:hypothetical protein